MIYTKDNCLWLKNDICHIKNDELCPDDCDLKDLEFDKESIIKRMKDEEINVKKLKKEGIFRNREKIKDKIMGIYTMQKALNKHFNHIEPKVIDKDIERTDNIPSFPTKGWRKKPNIKKRIGK